MANQFTKAASRAFTSSGTRVGMPPDRAPSSMNSCYIIQNYNLFRTDSQFTVINLFILIIKIVTKVPHRIFCMCHYLSYRVIMDLKPVSLAFKIE
jgi:hypothetical protein